MEFDEESRAASQHLERELGSQPSRERLFAKCVELQIKVWEGLNRETKWNSALSEVAEMGISREEELLKANATHLRKAFKNLPSGDVSDGLYPLRRIQEALQSLGLAKSQQTTKRLLKTARERDIIPRFEEEKDRTRLTREELEAFIRFVAGEF